jgi:hypothetical protein
MLVSVSARVFPLPMIAGRDDFGLHPRSLDVSFTVYAVSTPGSGHDQAQMLCLISSTRQHAATSLQTLPTQGGQRLLGRRVLTNRIGLPQVGHCASVVGNGWAGDGRSC